MISRKTTKSNHPIPPPGSPFGRRNPNRIKLQKKGHFWARDFSDYSATAGVPADPNRWPWALWCRECSHPWQRRDGCSSDSFLPLALSILASAIEARGGRGTAEEELKMGGFSMMNTCTVGPSATASRDERVHSTVKMRTFFLFSILVRIWRVPTVSGQKFRRCCDGSQQHSPNRPRPILESPPCRTKILLHFTINSL